MIYLDNGATSFPKPREVVEAVADAMVNYCANPGRGGHDMAMKTAKEIYRARISVAELFNIENPARIVFTKNCTEGINIALKGILKEGDHVITSSMEHNSVIRPLHALRKKGIRTTIIKCDREGSLAPEDLRRTVKPNTKMIVLTAASNVTGTKMPIEEIGRLALRKGIIFMVDGAQGAGHMEIDVRKAHIDILAAPGHKGLMGPQGTGFLYVREGIDISPVFEGGTGSKSKETKQPLDFPDGFEAGTVNAPGIIGLGAAVSMINKIGVNVISEHERRLTEKLQNAVEKLPQVKIYGPADTHRKTGVLAINIHGLDCEEAALKLNDEFHIAVRSGFHCSPMAHKTLGTENTGCVRICPGFYTSDTEIMKTIAALEKII